MLKPMQMPCAKCYANTYAKLNAKSLCQTEHKIFMPNVMQSPSYP